MTDKGPPRIMRWLAERLLPPGCREFVVGDLEEDYERRRQAIGGRRARRRFRLEAARAVVVLAPRWAARKSRTLSIKGDGPMRTLLEDLRLATRMLRHRPGFSAVAILALAAGIGVNAAIFTWIKAVVLEPLPGVPRSRDVLVLTNQEREGGGCCWGTSYPDFLDYSAGTRTLEGLAGYELASVHLEVNGAPERVNGTIVTANYFDVLRVGAALGRVFHPGEGDSASADPVAVVSDGLWRRLFGADPHLPGRQVSVNGKPFTIVGVMPRGFGGAVVGMSFDIYVPVGAQALVVPGRDLLSDRTSNWLDLFARPRPGVTVAQVRAEMDSLSRRIERDHPDAGENRTLGAYSLARAPVGASGAMVPVLLALMALVVAVLLIACANVANLLLARGTSRRREMAVRVAMGAGRLRLVRQLLTESAMLAALAGTIGLLLGSWASGLLARFAGRIDASRSFDLSLDGTVVGFTAAVSLLTVLLFGLAPALRDSRVDVLPAMKGVRSADRRGRLRSTLIVSQVALSFVALACAALFLRGLERAQQVDPGFDPDATLAVAIDLFPAGYEESRGRAFYSDLLARVRALPGVTAVSLARRPPLGGRGERGVWIDEVEGYTAASKERLGSLYDVVGPGYFRTLRIPLVRGRDFTDADNASAPPVTVVNETMASRFWPGQDPIGRHIAVGGRQVEVVGVARDVKHRGLAQPKGAYMYVPVLQSFQAETTLLVRAAGDPSRLTGAIREVLRSLDKSLPVVATYTMRDQVNRAMGSQRAAAGGASLFGALALCLAMVGLYGVVSFAVSQRVQEIGVRMALGARPADVASLVVKDGARLASIGLAVGLLAASGLGRFISTLLFGVSPLDPLALGGTAALLAGVALAASYLPARRASRIDPAVALRYE